MKVKTRFTIRMVVEQKKKDNFLIDFNGTNDLCAANV